MEREVLCTFSNGGQLIKAKESQIRFVKNLKYDEINRAIDLNILSYKREEYIDVILNVIRMKRYNTGKQTRILNELRMCFMKLPKKRRRL